MHRRSPLVLLLVQFSFLGRAEESEWVVGDLTEGGAAQEAGLRSGDRVVAFDGEPVGTFSEFRDQIQGASGEVRVEVELTGRAPWCRSTSYGAPRSSGPSAPTSTCWRVPRASSWGPWWRTPGASGPGFERASACSR
ncbi:MAG: PDZ domain-containing protein [Microthrixaceae bacterium]